MAAHIIMDMIGSINLSKMKSKRHKKKRPIGLGNANEMSSLINNISSHN